MMWFSPRDSLKGHQRALLAEHANVLKPKKSVSTIAIVELRGLILARF
jgi:hypothetical protein